jgi:DNA-binding NarL/FixJ family response regulator
MRAPVTVVTSTFEDLVAIGLRQILSEDTNLHLVAEGVPLDRLESAIKEHEPSVVLLNFGSLPSPAYVYQLHQQAPETRLVVLANRPSAAECNQLLSFGATACVSKETQGRDIINALHLASRGMHVMPRSAAAGPTDRLDLPEPDLLTAREADVLELLQQGYTHATSTASSACPPGATWRGCRGPTTGRRSRRPRRASPASAGPQEEELAKTGMTPA